MFRIGKPTDVAAQSTLASAAAIASVPVSLPRTSLCTRTPRSAAAASIWLLSCSELIAPTHSVIPSPLRSRFLSDFQKKTQRELLQHLTYSFSG